VRWPFRRRETPSAEPQPGPVPVDGVAGETLLPGGVGSPGDPPAWSSLPPIQRTTETGITLTAPSADVLGDISHRWSPATSLEPLGHELGALAPSGTIGLAGTPVEADRPGPVLVGRPGGTSLAIQRSPARHGNAIPPATGTPEPAVLPPIPAPFRAPVVEPAAVPTPVQRSLTTAAEPLGPPRRDVGGARDPGAHGPQSPEPTIHAASGPARETTPSVPVQRAVEPEPVTPRPVRRPGLGAPLSGARGGVTLQRSPRDAGPATTAEPVERPARVPVQRLALDELPLGRPVARTAADQSPPDSAPADTAERRSAEPSDEPPATPAHVAMPDPAPDPRPAAVLTGAIDVSRLAADPEPRSDPLRLVARPITARFASTSAQRAVDDDSIRSERPTTPMGALRPPAVENAPHAAAAGPLVVARSVAWVHEPALALPAISGDDNPAPALDRSSAAPPPSVPGHASTDVGVEAAPARSRPDLVALATVQRSPVRGGVVTPPPRPLPALPTLTLAHVSKTPPEPSSYEPSIVQRASEAADAGHAGGTANDGASTSMAAVPPALHDPGPELDIAIQRAADDGARGSAPTPAATSTPGGGPLAGGSDKDLDELARRLYDRIRRRLSRELLADRERAGILTDLR
jgi:hypothetical protein